MTVRAPTLNVARCIAAVVVAVVLASPSAAQAFTTTADTAPATITYFGAGDSRTTRVLEQRLHVQSGASDEQLLLTVELNRSPTSPAGALRIQGPGTLGPPRSLGASGSSSITADRDVCASGVSSSETVRLELRLPAGTRSTISFTQRIRLTAAPDELAAFAQRWELAPMPVGGLAAASGRLPGTVTVTSRPVKLAGLRAAKVVLRAGVAGSGRTVGDRERLAVRSGRTVVLSGFVNGARRYDRVTIWRFAPGATTAKPLALVRLDRRHRFSLPWLPNRRGHWELYASYAGRPGLVDAARSPCGGPQVQVTA